MKFSYFFFLLCIALIFSGGVAEASCWLDPVGGVDSSGQPCNTTLEYTPMVDLPGVTESNNTTSVASYISAVYAVAIVVAALLAVIRLVLAGAKYMMTDVVTSKGEAVNDIKNSLIGLLIIIAAFIILNTINPNLNKISIIGEIPGVTVSAGPDGGLGGLLVWTPNPPPPNILGNYEIMEIGDRIRTCQNYNSTDCAENICNPAGGAVVTTGLLAPDGTSQTHAGIPVCLIKAGTEPPEPPSGSLVFNNGVILVPGTEYSLSEQTNIIAAARADEILLGEPFVAAVGILAEKQAAATAYCNSQYSNSTAYIISRSFPASSMAMCITQ